MSQIGDFMAVLTPCGSLSELLVIGLNDECSDDASASWVARQQSGLIPA
jgi:hypothetical protein